eukprot:3745568-Pyramimonas_sp.AAC.1
MLDGELTREPGGAHCHVAPPAFQPPHFDGQSGGIKENQGQPPNETMVEVAQHRAHNNKPLSLDLRRIA